MRIRTQLAAAGAACVGLVLIVLGVSQYASRTALEQIAVLPGTLLLVEEGVAPELVRPRPRRMYLYKPAFPLVPTQATHTHAHAHAHTHAQTLSLCCNLLQPFVGLIHQCQCMQHRCHHLLHSVFLDTHTHTHKYTHAHLNINPEHNTLTPTP